MFALYALFSLLIAAADQLIKLWISSNLSLYEIRAFLPGVLCLTNVRNEGAAFSSLSGMQWLFCAVFLIFTAVMLWEYRRRAMPFTTLERWFIAAIWGGGFANMIDRIRLGYVVDMFCTEFMDFPVFNLADCFITCGCILLVIHLLLWNREMWRDTKNGSDS